MKFLRIRKPILLQKKHHSLYLAAFLLVLPVLNGCDSSESLLSNEETPQAASTSTLAATLDLNAEQIAAIEDLTTNGDVRKNPTRLWEMAKSLQETMTPAQKSTLLEEAEQKRAERAQLRTRAREGNALRGRRGGNLSLTEEQQETMKAHREEMKSLRTQLREGSMTREAFEAEAETLRSQMKETLESILTEEQLQKMEERENRRATDATTRTERRQDRLDARNEILGLTPEQQEALQTLREEQRATLQKMREEARAADSDRTEVREQMQALRTSLKEAHDEILTEEQRELLQIHQALGTLAREESENTGRRTRGRRGGRR